MHALSLLALLGPTLGPDPSDWPQWRGALGDGLSHGTAWTAEGRTLWSVEIGLGYSAPSVRDGRVFAFGFDSAKGEDVLCALAVDDGRELWRRSWPGELRDNQHEGGTLSTPAVTDSLVLVSTTEGLVRAFQVADGEPAWTADRREELGLDPQYYGFASSPVVDGELVLVGFDRALALRLATGELAWASEPLDARYSTPVPYRRGDEACVALLSQQALHLLGRADGHELARFPWHKSDRLVNAATPVLVGGRLFISSAYDHGCALVDFAEEPRALWESREMKNKMAGCVLVDGALYGFDESLLKCLDLEGGERWRVRGLGNGALSGGDGKLALLSSGGELVVARAGTSGFEELARTPLFEGGVCWTPPTIAGGRLYLRNNRGTLVCRDHRAGAATTSVAAAPSASVSGKPAAALPSAESLFEAHLAAVGGAERLSRCRALRLSGTYEQRSVGFVPAPYEIQWAASDRRRVQIQLPPPIEGHIARIHDGEAVFELNRYRGDKLYSPTEEREERTGAHVLAAAEWRALYAESKTACAEEFDERPCWKVEAATRDGGKRTLYFERASGLLAGREAEDEALVAYSDYKAFDGLSLPTRERCFRPENGIEETFRLERVEFAPVDEALFERSDKVNELLAERAAGAAK